MALLLSSEGSFFSTRLVGADEQKLRWLSRVVSLPEHGMTTVVIFMNDTNANANY